MPTIRIGDKSIDYEVEERPRRLHPAIRITPPATVMVLLPKGFGTQQIESLLQQRARWLLKHLSNPGRPPLAPKAFVSGEEFLYVGQRYRLGVVSGSSSLTTKVTLVGDELKIHLRESIPPGEKRAMLRQTLIKWYRQQAESLLTDRLDKYSEMLGAKATRVRLTELKTRWGYCRRDGLIAFSWRIVQAPLSVVDYIVVHELTHLRYPHHQRTFWEAVWATVPDYEAQKAWLRGHGAELMW